jgi:hypothetical protein
MFDHNQSGREFEMAAGDPQIGLAAGGTAPRGLNAYEPSGGPREPNDKGKINVRTKAGRLAAARALFMNKFSSIGVAVDQNIWPQGSDTVNNQPKYDQSSPNPAGQVTDNREADERAAKYQRASGKKKMSHTKVGFAKGLLKVATLTETISKILAEGVESGKEIGKGLKASGAHTLGDTLKLKGLSHVPEAAKAAGGMGKALSSKAGRLSLWHAAGKAVPSLGTAGVYGGLAYKGAKKLYDRSGSGGYGDYAQYGM